MEETNNQASPPAPTPGSSQQIDKEVPVASASLVKPESSKVWSIVTVILAFLTVLPYLFYIVMGGAPENNLVRQTGDDLSALIIIPPLLLIQLFLVVDIILAIVYLLKHKSKNKKRIFPIAVIAFSLILILYFVLLIETVSANLST